MSIAQSPGCRSDSNEGHHPSEYGKGAFLFLFSITMNMITMNTITMTRVLVGCHSCAVSWHTLNTSKMVLASVDPFGDTLGMIVAIHFHRTPHMYQRTITGLEKQSLPAWTSHMRNSSKGATSNTQHVKSSRVE